MTQYKITVDQEILQNLFSGNDEALTRLLEQILNQILEAQRTEQLQADRYQRNEERQGSRNGYKPRQLTTRVGRLNLRIPQIREGKFSTELFKRYQRSEQALVLSLMEMVINGVSTRKVAKITEELCGTEFSASTVSNLCKDLDPIIESWNNRPLNEKKYPFLLVDAMIIKIREGGKLRPHSALIATGINEEGHREILGMQIGNSETEQSWADLFCWLKERGLRGVDFIVSDDHRGLVKAIQTHFQGTIWQRCQTHFTRNILDKCPKRYQKDLLSKLQSIFRAPDRRTAELILRETIDNFETTAPKAMEVLEEGFEDATAIMILPPKFRKRLRTTNSVERLIAEIRRRERVIRIFPNQASAERLIGALLLEQHEEWATGRLYLKMDEYWEWKNQQEEQSSREKVVSLKE